MAADTSAAGVTEEWSKSDTLFCSDSDQDPKVSALRRDDQSDDDTIISQDVQESTRTLIAPKLSA